MGPNFLGIITQRLSTFFSNKQQIIDRFNYTWLLAKSNQRKQKTNTKNQGGTLNRRIFSSDAPVLRLTPHNHLGDNKRWVPWSNNTEDTRTATCIKYSTIKEERTKNKQKTHLRGKAFTGYNGCQLKWRLEAVNFWGC